LWAWPGAIHEGRGEAVLIIDEQTNPAPREAISGSLLRRGNRTRRYIFNVFTNVIDTYYEQNIAPIEFGATTHHHDRRNARGAASTGETVATIATWRRDRNCRRTLSLAISMSYEPHKFWWVD
jgi:hypothetical protein